MTGIGYMTIVKWPADGDGGVFIKMAYDTAAGAREKFGRGDLVKV
jgi:hypothetical protein